MSSNEWREHFKEEFLHLKMDKGLKKFLSSLVQQIWPFTETKNAKAKIVDFVIQNISEELAYDLSSLDTGELILERLKSILMEEVDKIFDINEGDNMNIRVPSHKLIFLENLKKRQFS